ncbi:hypothetical protein R69927_02271 [Paraburkholderia domus]|uniref:Uncharacterized protein n=1 Tax=Paraburkholderia domus TaxID=2793075 RepID=A0A9N8R0A7_9BURK|nr:hypothetical protein [Paraburkholderia domus]MBK5049550.1 hypothetical protein [Burkholderia sp. R-70006]MBK5061887.1 hypothetical protein [Burkholderia sp. R-70199]MBK5087140.1 hypothetical protein [Burkholderia sp. R-69927]MBK5123496.1 hypothetical protein [Burkholderia sp. R-69980]MBK5166727.1 hypothetical protein [Burkholderia sp. R-70211]MCI0151639.1 hypothetical protein [Paraburkholderia sediminicola]
MSDFTSYVRLPHTLTADKPSIVASGSIDDDQFAARQVEFVRHLFGYCTYLHEHARTTPVSDAFLAVFVMLLEVLELNAPIEARQCATQLARIMQVTFPGLEVETKQILDSAIAKSKRPDA